jgi:hypothetical protein
VGLSAATIAGLLRRSPSDPKNIRVNPIITFYRVSLEPLYALCASWGRPTLSALRRDLDDALKFLVTGNRFSKVTRRT